MAVTYEASNFPTGGGSGTLTDAVSGQSTVVTASVSPGTATFTDSGVFASGSFDSPAATTGTVAGTFTYTFSNADPSPKFPPALLESLV